MSSAADQSRFTRASVRAKWQDRGSTITASCAIGRWVPLGSRSAPGGASIPAIGSALRWMQIRLDNAILAPAQEEPYAVKIS